jgi:hypothetical protein
LSLILGHFSVVTNQNCGNPFTASRIRPGAIGYLFPAGQSAEQVLVRLERSGWWGQIVGPHGSGKSSLLAALLAAIKQRGLAAALATLHDHQRRLPAEFRAGLRAAAVDVVAIDGYEQLSLWSRFQIKRLCRRRGLGLLVTAHRPVGLPQLAVTAVNEDLAWRVVTQLQQGYAGGLARERVDLCLRRHPGNLRETLFALYDLWQQPAEM